MGRILSFAESHGLNASGAYKYYIATKEPVVSYIVQAAYADRLEFVTWWFPVVGDVPYLGFFKKPERDAKAAELTASGYDVHTSGAGAFSISSHSWNKLAQTHLKSIEGNAIRMGIAPYCRRHRTGVPPVSNIFEDRKQN